MSSSGASSPDRSHSSHDSFGDSDTDMSSSEPEWEFQERPATETGLKAHPNVKPLTDLPGLPTELHFQIFRYLDDIDSTCLGLSNSKSYSVYRAIHGTKVRLNTGRNGPNPMERAWEIVGKTSCAHCGNFRCQLFQHIKTWMPEELEYCQMTLKFGSKASDGARDTCYRGKPSKPNRKSREPISNIKPMVRTHLT